MRLAITSDVHLGVYQDTPDRYLALKEIIGETIKLGLDRLVICGDLFDQKMYNHSDFERLVSEYPTLPIWILPGNHDPSISPKNLIGKNLKIINNVEIEQVDDFQLVYVPYSDAPSMGDVLSPIRGSLVPGKWILFSHGDWMDGLRKPNPYEKGVYLPLTREVVATTQPSKVFLGHIHLASNHPVYYPGSPCGLDISETGKRRFLIFDTDTGIVESREVTSSPIYHSCILTILPVDHSESYIRDMIQDVIDSWAVEAEPQKKVVIRVTVQGYTADKGIVVDLVEEGFKDFTFYKNEKPNFDRLSVTVDQNKIKIAQDTKARIDSLDLMEGPDQPSRDDILMEAYKIIFEGKNGR